MRRHRGSRRTGCSSGPGPAADGILHKVDVDTEEAVVHIAAQPRQKRKRIADGFPDAAVPGTAGCGLIHPLLELQDDRIGFLLTPLLQSIAGDADFLRLVLDVVESDDVGQASLAGSVSICVQEPVLRSLLICK